MTTDPYLFLPSIGAIYLILISGAFSGLVKQRIQDYLEPDPVLRERSVFVANIALDWAARLSFFNSVILAILSFVSVLAKTQNFAILVVILFLFLSILIPITIWIERHRPDELVSIRLEKWNITPAHACAIILIAFNLLMMAVIAGAPSPGP